MTREIDAEEVAKHTSRESCWVILYDNVYDVTDFLADHPGGSKIILKLAGRDATDEYDPIHPPGTLEDNLKPEAKLGPVNKESLIRLQNAQKPKPASGDGPGSAAGRQEEKLAGKTTKKGRVRLSQLLNIDEIEAAATQRVTNKCWSYYYSAGDDMISKALNNTAYRSILLRPRVFVDCVACDTSTTLLGGTFKVGTPIYVSPTAMARLAHPDGEAGIAKGIESFGGLQCVSNNASMTPEQIVANAKEGQSFGWQLYVQNDRRKSEAMLARINKLRKFYKFIILTLDAPVPGKREIDDRAAFVDAPDEEDEEEKEPVEEIVGGTTLKKGSAGGVGRQMFAGTAADLTWHTTMPWLRKHTDLPIVLKGLQTHEDAYLAAKYARENPGTVKAIILSNHGGRALDTAPPAVHTLLEIRKYCPSVFDDVEVWVDGGIRRGTDVVKALCLGAKAVGVGRATLWGLGAGGWKGARRAFEILQAETETCMRLLGAKNVGELGPRFINTRAVERDIFDGDAGLDGAGLWEKAAAVKAKL